ncbi:MAG: HD domain-containing protein [Cyanobacteria bacterium P01_A01_bin.105]
MRTYHDPLHGAITLDGRDPVEALLIHLIDTPPFQRLRRIRQLGPASFTFHGAESSRFTHSLGVMAVARRAFDRLADTYAELRPHRAAVLVAALMHDVGHGPYSHTAEEVFGGHHEHWTQRILSEDDSIRSCLEAFSPDLLAHLKQIYAHQHQLPIVWQLISSQLDCDRLDYLMRDSYYTGACYGQLDLDRILLALDYDAASQQLVVHHKGQAAIEHYLVVRYLMYAQVYNHPKNLSATWMLERIFDRARALVAAAQLEADDIVTAWLTYPVNDLPLDQYLAGDDVVFTYHIQRWQRHPDKTLADLCRRFTHRQLLKTSDVTDYSLQEQATLLAKIQQQAEQQGLESDCYSGLRRVHSRGYTLYQRGIKLSTQHGPIELSQRSPLVKTLTLPDRRTWLIYPPEIQLSPSDVPAPVGGQAKIRRREAALGANGGLT